MVVKSLKCHQKRQYQTVADALSKVITKVWSPIRDFAMYLLVASRSFKTQIYLKNKKSWKIKLQM